MWVQSEKEQLAQVMQRHDIEWEQKGTHDQHLSVLDFKKQERAKEVDKLNTKLADKKEELAVLDARIQNFGKGIKAIEKLEQEIELDDKYQLPDPPTLMSAKTYKQRFVDPLIKRLKSVITAVFKRYYEALDSYHRLNTTNGRLYRENEHLRSSNESLIAENDDLHSETKDFRLLRKVFGSKQIDSLIAQAKEQEQQRKQKQRSKNKGYER